jgi:hypothetical protein
MSTAALTTEMKKFQASLRPHKRAILEGTLLSIDPGSISLGWAWFMKGEMVISGEYKSPRTVPPHKRLPMIMDQLAQWTNPDIMAIELLFKLNHSLLWAAGAAISTARPDSLISVGVRLWKATAEKDPNYFKSDEWDAIMIGRTVIETARGLK